MIKLKKRTKGMIGLALAFAFLLSCTACGSKDVVVDDYGNDSQIAKETEGTATSKEASIEQGDGRGLRETFGEKLTWKESFVSQGTAVDVNVSSTVPDIKNVNVEVRTKSWT